MWRAPHLSKGICHQVAATIRGPTQSSERSSVGFSTADHPGGASCLHCFSTGTRIITGVPCEANQQFGADIDSANAAAT